MTHFMSPSMMHSMTLSIEEKRIIVTHSSRSVIYIVAKFDKKLLIIPPHQREYSWNLSRQRKFIRTVLKGYPIPNILMSEENSDLYIEDGRQRIETLTRFMQNMFDIDSPISGDKIMYSDLTDNQRKEFNNTPIQITEFSGATPEERIEIFDFWQNGAPLTFGERYHAQYNSPLVSFVNEILMTPGKGYHDRAAKIWGVRGDPVDKGENFVSKDKHRKWLLNGTALIMGLLYGPSNATKKYEPDKGFITREIPNAKKEAVKRDLERILEIFEDANERVPLEVKKNARWHNRYWDVGNFMGYMLHSFSASAREEYNDQQMEGSGQSFEDSCYAPNSLANKPEEEEHIKDTWVDYISGLREHMKSTRKRFRHVLKEPIHVHANPPSSRAYNICRWDDGFKRVFRIPLNDTLLLVSRRCSPSCESEEPDGEEEDDNENSDSDHE